MIEEKMIDDILHRKTERGDWEPYTLKAMCIAFVAMRDMYEKERNRANELEQSIKSFVDFVNKQPMT